MAQTLKRLLGASVSILLAFIVLTVTAQSSNALSGSTFKPGLIISDTVFGDYGTMSPNSIQSFLEGKVPNCNDGDGGPKCLRNYSEPVVGSVAIRAQLHDYNLHLCDTVPESTAPVQASRIIYQVAVACKINPQVLLVTLEKEQGLVTASNPTVYMYKAAMGYGCPDSAPQICGQDSNAKSRLFWQLYRAAWQFNYYGHPAGTIKYYRPNAWHNIQYNPKTSCGSKAVFVESQATADLYYYTPYQPNAAALSNLYGSGDSCSAYGNRNFWRYFWNWFGNPIVGVNLITTSTTDGSPVFLVNLETNTRYLVPSASIETDYKALGSVGVHSSTFVNSFTDGGAIGSIIQDSAHNRYLIASGLKYQLANTAQATALGLNWDTAPLLTGPQVSKFGDMVFAKSASNPTVYLIQGSTKAPVENPDLLKALSVMGQTATLQDTILNGFTLADTVNDLVQDTEHNRYDIQDGQKIAIPTEALATAIGRNWSTATTVATAQLAKIKNAVFLKTAASKATYFVTEGTKHLTPPTVLSSMTKFGGVATVSADYLTRFTSGPDVTPLLKTSPTDVWYIASSQRFKITRAQSTAMGLDFDRALTATSDQLGNLDSPILMKATSKGQTFLVTNYSEKYPLAAADLSNYNYLGNTAVISSAYLNAFTTKGDPGRFVHSSDTYNYYLVGTSKYRVANIVTAKAIAPAVFGSATNFDPVPSLTTAQLARYTLGSSSYVTTYTKGSGGNFIIENGHRLQVLDAASLTARMAPGAIPAVSALSSDNFAKLPLGNPIVLEASIFKSSDSSSYGIYQAGVFYPMPADLFNDIHTSSSWHFNISSGTLLPESLAKLTSGTQINPIVISNNVGYLLGGGGKQPLADLRNITASPSSIPAGILSKIDASTVAAPSTPFVVKTSTDNVGFLVANHVKRQIIDAEESAALAPLTAAGTAQTWLPSAVDQIELATIQVMAPGSVVKVKESGHIFLIDGWLNAIQLTTAEASAFGKATPKVIPRIDLAGYTTASTMAWQKVICGSNTYLVDQGSLLLLDSGAASQWPGSATTLDSLTCQRLTPTSTHVGTFVSGGTTKYQVISGKLKPIRTNAEYTTLLGSQTPAVAVSPALISSLPKLNPTSYVVVAKDTLVKVATKFKTTKARLKSINNLTSDILTKGQVLILP